MIFIKEKKKELLIGFLILFIVGFVFLLIPAKHGKHYKIAYREAQDYLRRPETMYVKEAYYDEDQILIKFDGKNSYGMYTGYYSLGVYYFAGEDAGRFYVTDEGEPLYRSFQSLIDLDAYKKFPNWQAQNKINPTTLIGIIFMSLAAVGAAAVVIIDKQ